MRIGFQRDAKSGAAGQLPPTVRLEQVAELVRRERRGDDDKRELLRSPNGFRVGTASDDAATRALELRNTSAGLVELVARDLRSRNVRTPDDAAREMVGFYTAGAADALSGVLALSRAVNRAGLLQDDHGISMAHAVQLVHEAHRGGSPQRGLDEERLERAAKALRSAFAKSPAAVWGAQRPSSPAESKQGPSAAPPAGFASPEGADSTGGAPAVPGSAGTGGATVSGLAGAMPPQQQAAEQLPREIEPSVLDRSNYKRSYDLLALAAAHASAQNHG